MTGLELVGVRKSYGELVAVEHLDLSVSAGEVVALLGPNGAGKSTTIDILLGLTRPDSGTARVWGLEPRQACRAGHVGAMLQAGGLLGSVTVKELVQLVRGLSACPLPLAEALALARVEDVADQRADRLSGGQAQRVRFALAVGLGAAGAVRRDLRTRRAVPALAAGPGAGAADVLVRPVRPGRAARRLGRLARARCAGGLDGRARTARGPRLPPGQPAAVGGRHLVAAQRRPGERDRSAAARHQQSRHGARSNHVRPLAWVDN